MNLEQRKLRLAQTLLKLNDVSIIEDVEDLLKRFKADLYESNLKPMTVQELHDRVEQAEEDFEKGRVINAQDLLKKYNLD